MISTAISQLPSLRDINGGQSSAPSSPLLATRKVEVGGEAHITIVRKGALKSTKAGGEYTLDGCAPGTRHGSPIASLERLSNLPSNSKLALSLNTQGGEGPLLKSKTKSAVRVDRPTSAKKSSSRLSTPAKQSKPTSARPTSAGKRPGSGGKVSATGPKRSKSPSSAGRTRIGSAKSWTKPGASPSAAGTGQKLKIKKPVEVPKRPLTLKEQQLLEACDRGDLDFLYECLWRNPDINCRKPVFGSSPLSVACRKGNGKVASLLLSFGADVAAQDEYGVTPLHWAANSGDSNLVTLILRKAASTGNLGSLVHVPSPTSLQNTGDSGLLSRKDLFGSTPLHFASVNNMPGAVKALRQDVTQPLRITMAGNQVK
ncbi:ankyrin repeat-containing domain protein [Phlyctochytrium arcticum]|nr:ankyrin repeat-containing domain protein [Phlyctochytrium arcticum]